MITVYLVDNVLPFDEADQLLIEKDVEFSQISVCGSWIKFGVILSGVCERKVIYALEERHRNLARRYSVNEEGLFYDEEIPGVVGELGGFVDDVQVVRTDEEE